MGGTKRKLLGMVAALTLAAPFAAPGWAADGPDTVVLDKLANHYEAVQFNHAMHVDVAGNCAVCHHHTTGTAPVDPNCARCHKAGNRTASVACRDCHSDTPFSADNLKRIESDPRLYHSGKPGLKGALHQKCLGCHTEMGAPTGCQDCHARNDKGDAFFNAGKYAPAPGKGGEHGH